MKPTAGTRGENPKSVFKRIVAFQANPARAAAEDAADVAWEAEADHIFCRVSREQERGDPNRVSV